MKTKYASIAMLCALLSAACVTVAQADEEREYLDREYVARKMIGRWDGTLESHLPDGTSFQVSLRIYELEIPAGSADHLDVLEGKMIVEGLREKRTYILILEEGSPLGRTIGYCTLGDYYTDEDGNMRYRSAELTLPAFWKSSAGDTFKANLSVKADVSGFESGRITMRMSGLVGTLTKQ